MIFNNNNYKIAESAISKIGVDNTAKQQAELLELAWDISFYSFQLQVVKAIAAASVTGVLIYNFPAIIRASKEFLSHPKAAPNNS